MADIQSGYPFYGQHVAVLVFSTTTPRTPGDAGNNASFRFPVRYEIVEGGFADLIQGSPQILQRLKEAALRMKALGMRAIVGDCGLMSLYQQQIAQAGLPAAASSLCMLPSIWQMVGRQGSIGILTGHSRLLTKAHLLASGWDEGIAVSVQGMEEEAHFREIVIEGGHHLDPELMLRDVLSAADKLREKTPGLSALVIECSNLGTYSRALYERLRVPVLDIISCAVLLERMVNPEVF